MFGHKHIYNYDEHESNKEVFDILRVTQTSSGYHKMK